MGLSFTAALSQSEGWGAGGSSKQYLLLELFGGVVVNQRHGEGHGLAVAHQRKQHPGVCSRADPSHSLHCPGGLRPAGRGRPRCKEGHASPGSPDSVAQRRRAGPRGALGGRGSGKPVAQGSVAQPSGTDREPGIGLQRPQPTENSHMLTPQEPL